MKKRGQLIQFNWMFVIIAGAVILVFFSGFAIKYKGLQQERNEVEVLKQLDNILFSLQANSLPTTNKLDIPVKSGFDCKQIIVNNKAVETENLAASPIEFQGPSVIWYQPWKSPFRITNFYYIIPLDYQIYLVYDDSANDHVNALLNKIPSTIKGNFEKIKPNQVRDQNGKFVYFSEAVNELQVIPEGSENGFLKLNGQEFPYDNFELLMAGIFSKDLLEYNCMREQAISSYDTVALSYKQKAIYLASKQPQCSYSAVITLLSKAYNVEDSLTLSNNNKFLSGQGCVEVF